MTEEEALTIEHDFNECMIEEDKSLKCKECSVIKYARQTHPCYVVAEEARALLLSRKV